MLFADGDEVAWDDKYWKTGFATGRVRGYGSTELPDMGAMVIIEVDGHISESYPFRFLCLPEVALTRVIGRY